MRRLDIKPLKKLRGRARYERAFRRDMGQVARWFPEPRYWARGYDNWKLPIYEKVASERHGSPAFRREVVQTLVDTAQAVVGNRPKAAAHGRVAAIIGWPDLFTSEICVFFDPIHAQRFDPEQEAIHSRQALDGGWVESRAPERDLFTELDIALPDGFTGGGLAFEEHDEEFGETYAWERWVAMETSEGTAA